MRRDQQHASDYETTIRLEGDVVDIHNWRIEDSALAGLLKREPEESHLELLRTIVEVGTRGVLTMGMGIDLDEIDQRVERSVAQVTSRAEDAVTTLLEKARAELETTLDPDQRQSVMSKTLREFDTWRQAFLAEVDPDDHNGPIGRLFAGLNDLLADGGPFEARLEEALDPNRDGSAVAVLASQIDKRFGEIRDLISTDRGRRQERETSTRKGFEFEDELEESLRSIGRALGAVVERTSDTGGLTGSEVLVGDFTISLPSGHVIVIEAKHTATISLTGKEGILDELDRAMANRAALVGVCVSKNDAFPAEVGSFGVYGNRILVVDDGEGTLLQVGLRWAQLLCQADLGRRGESVDTALVFDRLERIRQVTQRFSSNRRALTGIAGSVEQVRSSLDEMRNDLLDLIDDIDRAITTTTAPVVPLALSAG